MNPIYPLGQRLGRFCFSSFGRLEVRGEEAVPPYGPLILVANHLSFNDPPLLLSIIRRRLNFIGKQELFGNPISRFTLQGFGVHSFDRSGHAVDMVRLTLRMLAEDRAVALFPEGHRSPDHSLKQGMPGAAYIAFKSQATLLPVAISGTEKFPTWRLPFPLCQIRVTIGQPFTLPMLEGRPSRAILKSLTDMIMYRIAALLPEEYRGVYAMPEVRKLEGLAPSPSRSGGAATG